MICDSSSEIETESVVKFLSESGLQLWWHSFFFIIFFWFYWDKVLNGRSSYFVSPRLIILRIESCIIMGWCLIDFSVLRNCPIKSSCDIGAYPFSWLKFVGFHLSLIKLNAF